MLTEPILPNSDATRNLTDEMLASFMWLVPLSSPPWGMALNRAPLSLSPVLMSMVFRESCYSPLEITLTEKLRTCI